MSDQRGHHHILFDTTVFLHFSVRLSFSFIIIRLKPCKQIAHSGEAYTKRTQTPMTTEIRTRRNEIKMLTLCPSTTLSFLSFTKMTNIPNILADMNISATTFLRCFTGSIGQYVGVLLESKLHVCAPLNLNNAHFAYLIFLLESKKKQKMHYFFMKVSRST